MWRYWAGVLATFMMAGSAVAQTVTPTAKDVSEFRASTATSRSYSQSSITAWEADLRADLARGSLQSAADALAAKYGFSQSDMRRLVNAWVIGQARHYEMREGDQRWRARVRADLLAILPSARRQQLGLIIIVETLEAIGNCADSDCSADTDDDEAFSGVTFDALMAGSRDPAADAYVIATTAASSDNFVRAALAAPDHAMPALIRLANWGSLPPRDTLPLYAWLTSPVALSRIDEAGRPGVSALLWQRYLELLLKVGLDSKALSLLDSLPADMHARVLAGYSKPLETVRVDGIEMSFLGESGSATHNEDSARRNTSEVKTWAPILQVAEALTVANRQAEARTLLETLPGLDAARKVARCQFDGTNSSPGCAHLNANEMPMEALTLDHLLNHGGDDPYPVAETVLVNPHGNDNTAARAETLCRVFPVEQFPDVCANARAVAIAEARLDAPAYQATEAARGDAALLRLLPGFAVARDGFISEVAALYGKAPADADRSHSRATVTPVTPGFVERSLPSAARGPLPAPRGLSKLPAGFELVRAERVGQRAIAISLSQSYDPTGELSRGGYWVHISGDGGAHWQKPLYTGLADRFPYVVVEQSSLPLLSGDMINLAVDIAQIDTASVSYPPVALRTARRKSGLYLEIPLADLRRDGDGDGLPDVAARHLLLDRARTDGGTPFVVGSDRGVACDAPRSPDRQARVALLGKLFDPSAAAIVEPVDRPAGEIGTGWQRATASADRPLFLLGDPKDYACLHVDRPMIVYSKDDIAAIEHFTPDFHAMELPSIVFNRAHDRGYVRWSAGWAGGTYRLRLLNGHWSFDELGSWIT